MDDRRVRAESLYEEIGGDLCICQGVEVPHWCESCQRRIDLIEAAMARENEMSRSRHPKKRPVVEERRE